MPTVQDYLAVSLLQTKSPSSCTGCQIHWIQRKVLKVHFSYLSWPIVGIFLGEKFGILNTIFAVELAEL